VTRGSAGGSRDPGRAVRQGVLAYLKAGREVAVDGRLLFDELRTQDGAYASRVYIVAERVEFLATGKPSNGQATDEASPDKPASDGAAREAHQAA
jgi:single-stranded DNA-binding protein